MIFLKDGSTMLIKAAKAMFHHAIPTDLPLDNSLVPGEQVQALIIYIINSIYIV